MDLAEPAGGGSGTAQTCALPRVKAIPLTHLKTPASIAGERQQGLNITLQIKEIDLAGLAVPVLRQRRAVEQTRQHWLLTQAICRWQKAQPGLHQTQTLRLPVQVIAGRSEQAGPEAATHYRQLTGNRIRQRQRLHTRRYRPLGLQIDKAVADHFLIATVLQGIDQPPQGLLPLTDFRLRRHAGQTAG